jgi:hypothetical protein
MSRRKPGILILDLYLYGIKIQTSIKKFDKNMQENQQIFLRIFQNFFLIFFIYIYKYINNTKTI